MSAAGVSKITMDPPPAGPTKGLQAGLEERRPDRVGTGGLPLDQHTL